MTASSARVVPAAAAALFEKLVQASPTIVTEQTIKEFLDGPGDAKTMIKRLVRLKWLTGVGVRGAWAFIPPGVEDLADPYLGLRGWRAVAPHARFALAGETALWHLGYLRRRPQRVTIWLPSKTDLPKGLEGKFHLVTTAFPTNVDIVKLGPSFSLMKKRKLDVTAWSSRLPAFGPEAVLAQIAQRPASITTWIEVAPRVREIVADIDIDQLKHFLSASTDAAKQRAAYLCEIAGAPMNAMELLPRKLVPVDFGKRGRGHWDNITKVTDRLVRPFLEADAKG